LPRCAALILAAPLALAGCRRASGPPDANYQQARELFQQLYAVELDDAYGDPKIDEVEALLKKVDGSSVDAPAAQTMLDGIAHGREVFAKEAKARASRAAVDGQVAVASPSNIDPAAFLAAAAPDAGIEDPYGPGAAIATLNRDNGGCLQANEPFNEQGTAVTGTVYRIASSQGCKDRLPGFVGQAVLVVDGKIYRRMTDPRPPPPPAAPAAVPDAGAPQQAAAPRKPVPRPDAGEPEYRIYVPGNPMPENEKPAAGGEQQQR